MEIFYGAEWSMIDRASYARFLRQVGFKYYLYGPKADESLRKNWTRRFSSEELLKFRRIRDMFTQEGLKFGMVLSPHGMDRGMDLSHARSLQAKIAALDEIGLDYLGLFFDDMKSAPDLAYRQLEIARLVQNLTSAKIVFCPSFYCHDPMLNMLFGERPPGYLETLGIELPQEIEILWTGEQIISPQITRTHLQNIGAILRRKPFICDNFYANDGPMNCVYLRLQPPAGRARDVFAAASHWAFNPMNQAHLSQVALLAFIKYAQQGLSEDAAFESALVGLVPPATAEFLRENIVRFSQGGLETISEGERAKLRAMLAQHAAGPIERELMHWLEGRYSIDFMAMIEQSCYVG
jgi:hyaluronoglucosaminidase